MRLIKFIHLMYGKKIDLVNQENYKDIIPKYVTIQLFYVIIEILFIIFGGLSLKIMGSLLLLYSIVMIIVHFLVYSSFYLSGNNHNTKQDIEKAYELLKLSENDDIDTIKKRYRDLSKLYHPDKYSNETKEKQEIANRNFQKLNKAYTLIKKTKGIS